MVANRSTSCSFSMASSIIAAAMNRSTRPAPASGSLVIRLIATDTSAATANTAITGV